MSKISEQIRRFVTERAQGCCEYCQTQKSIVIVMEVEHIIPETVGGLTEPDNLCLSCYGCNRYKSDFQTAIDPETDQEVAFFNPRHQIWNEHFEWSEDATILIGLTPIGRATINRLKINRDEMILARQKWASVGWHPPTL